MIGKTAATVVVAVVVLDSTAWWLRPRPFVLLCACCAYWHCAVPTAVDFFAARVGCLFCIVCVCVCVLCFVCFLFFSRREIIDDIPKD